MNRRLCFTLLALALFAAAGCRSQRNQSPDIVPTSASIEGLATALPLTQNAPPPPFDAAQIGFARIDAQLNQLAGARYVVQLEFTGTLDGTDQAVDAFASAEVRLDQLTSARRVEFSTRGSLFDQDEESRFEAVRLGEDAYLVRDGVCLSGSGPDAQAAASLSAGDLVGGVVSAVPAGRRDTVNDEDVYAYTVAPENLLLPSVRMGDQSRVQVDRIDLWIAPARGVVVSFQVHLTVEQVMLLDRPTPVSGTLILRYDAYELNQPNNISIPFGC